MRETSSWRLALAVCVALGAGACGGDAEPAKPADVRDRLPVLLAGMVDQSGAAFEAVQSSAAWDSLDELLDRVGGVASDTARPAMQRLRVDLRRLWVSHLYQQALGEDRTPGERLADDLLEGVFDEARYEGEGVWRIDGVSVCPVSELSPPGPDRDCVRMIEQLEIRLRVTLAGAQGLDLALLIGPGRDEVLSIALRPDEITVTIDLAEIRSAIEHFASVTGARVRLPEVMEGRVSGTLAVDGPEAVRVEASIEQEIRVEGEGVEVSIEARRPFARVRLTGGDRPALDLFADWGRTRASVPGGERLGGRVDVDLGGLGGHLVLDGTSDAQVTFEDLGLGLTRSEVKVDGQRLIAIDLNPDAGRRLDVTIDAGGDRPEVALAPGLDLTVELHLAAIADRYRVPPYLLDETYRVQAEGMPRLALVERADGSEAVEVLAGTLRLSSSTGAAVVVAAGQCLVDDPVTDGEHELLGGLAAAPCR